MFVFFRINKIYTSNVKRIKTFIEKEKRLVSSNYDLSFISIF